LVQIRCTFYLWFHGFLLSICLARTLPPLIIARTVETQHTGTYNLYFTSQHNLITLFLNNTTSYFQTPKLQIMVDVVAPEAVAPPVGGQPLPSLVSVLAVPPSKDRKYYPDMDTFMKVSTPVSFSLCLS
jgi:hypothetical protein